MGTSLYPEGSGALKSRYVDNVLVFYTPAGVEIYRIDPATGIVTYATGATLRLASGATLELQSGSVATLSDEILAGADIALAYGSVLVGDSGGAGSALDAKTDGRILVGNGTTVASVAVSGDATLANTGALALAADSVDLSHLGADTNVWLNAIRTWLADGMAAIATITISAVSALKFKTTTTAIYSILGLFYSKAATDALVFSAANTINTAAGAGTLWGIWLVQINAAGTISTKPGAADMTYANEAAAIAALPAVDASNVQLGYITVQALEATDWVANTDNLTVGGGAGNCTARTFYDLPAAKSLPAAL